MSLDAITVEDSRMHAFSEAQWVTWEDVDWQRKEIIVRGNPDTGTKNGEIRQISIIPDMEALLTKMKAEGLSSENTAPHFAPLALVPAMV